MILNQNSGLVESLTTGLVDKFGQELKPAAPKPTNGLKEAAMAMPDEKKEELRQELHEIFSFVYSMLHLGKSTKYVADTQTIMYIKELMGVVKLFDEAYVAKLNADAENDVLEVSKETRLKAILQTAYNKTLARCQKAKHGEERTKLELTKTYTAFAKRHLGADKKTKKANPASTMLRRLNAPKLQEKEEATQKEILEAQFEAMKPQQISDASLLPEIIF